MKFKVRLTLFVEADNADDANEMGIAMCEHLVDTFNDNDSISPLVSVDAQVVEPQP
jgi:flagellar biosynthesis regulator FlbT